MRNTKFVIFVGIWMLFISQIGFAGEFKNEELELGEVVVTGTKTERKITEVPAAIDVVTKEDIKNSKGWNVGEVLESLPGIQAQSKNGGYDAHIVIRGAGAKAAYGVRGIMIMVDGVPITDPDSLSRLDVVDTSLIERIEILKGPNSTLYGANAAGGVINIITKDSLGYQGLGLKSSVGSYNSNNIHLSYGGEFKDKLFYFLSASRRSTDSWRDHNKFETNQLNGKFNYLIDESSNIDLLLSYSEANMELPGSLTEKEFMDDPTQVSSDWPNTGRDSETTRLTLGYEKEFSGDLKLKTQLYFQDWKHYHPVPRLINDGEAEVSGAEFQLDIPHSLWKTENVLTVGLSGQRDDRDSKKFTYKYWNRTSPYTSSDETGELASEGGSTVEKWGVYLQESLRPMDDLLIDLGIRYDEVIFDLDREEYIDWGYIFVRPPGTSCFGYKADRNSIDIEEKWEKFSPRAGINYTVIEGLSLYGTVGTGFQTPTQGELVSNIDLKPQEAVNYEIGFKGRHEDGHKLDTTFFCTLIDDEITKLMDEDGLSYYDNAGKTKHLGLEISGRVLLYTGLYLGGTYTYSEFTFDEFDEMERVGNTVITHSRDGNRIPLVPDHQYSAFLDYRHSSGISARINTDIWGKYFVNAANSESYKGMTVFSGKLGYDWKEAGFFFRVDNILDKKYAAEVSESYGTTRFSPAAPRTWTTGVSYKF